MKNIAFTLSFICLICQTFSIKLKVNQTPLPPTDNRIEYINNRNFNQDISVPSWGLFPGSSVKYWRITGDQFEFGLGTIYNRRWSAGIVVAEMDVLANQIITQTFPVSNEADCDFSFQYSAKENGASKRLDTCGIEVKVNGKVLLSLKSLPDYEVKTFTAKVKSVAGINKVEFSDISISDAQGTVISQASFKCPPDTRVEYIKNRFFKDGITVPATWGLFDSKIIPFWKSTGSQFEIGNGRATYNKDWFENWSVNEMDVYKNEVVSQDFNAPSVMTCDFSFYYASKEALALTTSGIEVKYNGGTVLSLKNLPNNNLQFFSASVVTKVGSNTVSFADLGTADSLGTTISGVSFLCPPTPVVPVLPPTPVVVPVLPPTPVIPPTPVVVPVIPPTLIVSSDSLESTEC